MTFNFLGPGLTVNVEAKVKEQIILDSSEGKQGKIFTQLSGSCTYAKILRKNNKAFIRDRESVLVWKTPIGSFVLAFDLTANGINGVYVDAEENYSLKEEVLFFRWVEESGRLLP